MTASPTLLGIDLGIHKVGIALFVEGELEDAQAYAVDKDADRDYQLHELATWVHGYGSLYDVDSIWIEDVLVGNNRKYSLALAETKGALSSALYQLRLQFGTELRFVGNGTWKKQVIGDGHASKEKIQNYIRVTHPLYAPLCGDDQNLYDATCVGLYGLRIHERAIDLSLD